MPRVEKIYRQERALTVRLTDTDLLAWWARHPEVSISHGAARELAYLEYEYGGI